MLYRNLSDYAKYMRRGTPSMSRISDLFDRLEEKANLTTAFFVGSMVITAATLLLVIFLM